LKAVTETLFHDGGLHVQYYVVGRETLLDAQQHLEQYHGPVARVAGYSAFYTALDSPLQDDIIFYADLGFGETFSGGEPLGPAFVLGNRPARGQAA
jgi:formate C-acetyltransferase